jgi:arsenate reductase (thioredoxin)
VDLLYNHSSDWLLLLRTKPVPPKTVPGCLKAPKTVPGCLKARLFKNFLTGKGHGNNMRRLIVLFLCTGNSCRSQMAEGWTRHLKGKLIEVFSAGIENHGLNPLAVQVMAEVSVDISGQRSKIIADLPPLDFDYVITVCAAAHETCPVFRGDAKTIHIGFDDPPRLAANATTEKEVLIPYRRIRDEIRAFVKGLPETLSN